MSSEFMTCNCSFVFRFQDDQSGARHRARIIALRPPWGNCCQALFSLVFPLVIESVAEPVVPFCLRHRCRRTSHLVAVLSGWHHDPSCLRWLCQLTRRFQEATAAIDLEDHDETTALVCTRKYGPNGRWCSGLSRWPHRIKSASLLSTMKRSRFSGVTTWCPVSMRAGTGSPLAAAIAVLMPS